MKHKSKIYISFCWIKIFDVERFLEKILWILLNNSKQTNTLAKPDVWSPNSKNFDKKNFSWTHSKILVPFSFNFFFIQKITLNYKVFAW